MTKVLCSVDCASLYNLVNKTNLVHNLFLVHLSISTCFGRLWAHHQEEQLCLCDTWYLLFCVDDSHDTMTALPLPLPFTCDIMYQHCHSVIYFNHGRYRPWVFVSPCSGTCLIHLSVCLYQSVFPSFHGSHRFVSFTSYD